MDKNSKIFVAGGTGMVGSAIIRKLLERGYENIISNYHNRTPEGWRYESRITFIKLDLTDQQAAADFYSRQKPEYVFLAAAKAGGILANNTYRADFIYQNLQIQNNVIHQGNLNDVRKLMFLGSSCIYPKECPLPMREDYLLTSPLEYTNEPYSIAKIAGLKMCESYNMQYGTDYISVMPTNLYGPNDNYDLEKSHVLPALIRKMHLGKCLQERDFEAIRKDFEQYPVSDCNIAQLQEVEIIRLLKDFRVISGSCLNSEHPVSVEVWGSGKPRREFLYSEDMADACVYLMERIGFHDLIGGKKEIRNTHINIGSGEDCSIRELAELVKQIVGFSGELLFNTQKPDGTMQKLLDISKIKDLGWVPESSLEEGIRRSYLDYLQAF